MSEEEPKEEVEWLQPGDNRDCWTRYPGVGLVYFDYAQGDDGQWWKRLTHGGKVMSYRKVDPPPDDFFELKQPW